MSATIALVPAEIGEVVPGVVCYAEIPDDLSGVGFFVPRYMGPIADLQATARMPDLDVVQLLTAGYDHVLPYLPPGVTLCNAGGLHDASTAELAMALILAKLRRIDDFARAQTSGTWLRGRFEALADKRVVIVGFGGIGRALARRLEPFEVDIVPVASRARVEDDHHRIHGVDELPTLLPDADVVVMITPLTDHTRGMVDAEFLGHLKGGALFVNVARGAVVDTDALTAEAATGRINVALDVTDPEPLPRDHPLWTFPNVLISPHVGGNSSAFLPRARRLVAMQVTRWQAGEQLASVVAQRG